MRKFRIIVSAIIILGLVMLGVGCKGEDVTESKSAAPAVEVKVLSGYPMDFMPLFNVLQVNSNAYAVREDVNFVIGKDIYTIEFQSSAAPEEISKYYKGLMDSVDAAASFSDLEFEGLIGEQRLGVNISDQTYDNAPGYEVWLTFGVPKEDYAKTNHYFSTYPKDMVKEFGYASSKENTYLENYLDNQVDFGTFYITQEAPDKVLNFYRENYSTATDFKETEDDTITRFTWQDGDFQCAVTYSDSEGTDTIGIHLTKPLK